MHETAGQDDVARLLSMFLRGRDVPCPLCGYTLRDLTDKGFDATAIRYVLMSTHYRQPLNFTLDGINAAKEDFV